jgi:putative ABC transport system permease protein
MAREVAYSLRRLWRARGALFAAVVSLALGLGVNASLLAYTDLVLFRPPAHVDSPERLIDVSRARNHVRFRDLQKEGASFTAAAYSAVELTLEIPHRENVTAWTQCVTERFFYVAGTQVLLGRSLDTEQRSDFGVPVAVLSFRMWERHFDSDSSVLNTTVRLANKTFTIVGVAAKGFRGLDGRAADLWIPLNAFPQGCSFDGTDLRQSTDGSWLRTVGRLHTGATLLAAQVETSRILSRGASEEAAPSLQPLFPKGRRSMASAKGRLALYLAAGALIVLIISCGNVAGLLSVQYITRREEFLTRVHLGATRSRILKLLVTENGLLIGCGLLAAGLVRFWTNLAMQRYTDEYVPAFDIRTWILVLVLGVAVMCLAGILPALWEATRRDPWARNNPTARAVERPWGRSVLVIAQIGLSLALAATVMVFARSVHHLEHDTGFDSDRLVVATVDLQSKGYQRNVTQESLEAIVERLNAMPRIAGAALSFNALFSETGHRLMFPLASPGTPATVFASLNAVSPTYFTTVGTRLAAGRGFTSSDTPESTPVVIVGGSVASLLWPHGEIVGRCVRLPRVPCAHVIGVSESRRNTTVTLTSREIFVPLAQAHLFSNELFPRTIIARGKDSTSQVAADLTAAIRAVGPAWSWVHVKSVSEMMAVQTLPWYFGLTSFALFSSIALGLSVVGVYAQLSSNVARRTKEIGVRMALGATPSAVVARVLRETAVLWGVGWALGVGVFLLCSRLLTTIAFDVRPTNLSGILVASVAIAAATAAGCLIPAIRAARTDPAITLRSF